MGMYTEFLIDCRLRADTPKSLVKALNLLVNERDLDAYEKAAPSPFDAERERTPEGRAFFNDHRYAYLGNPQGDPNSSPEMFGEPAEWTFADDHLRIGTEVKNYDSVLDKFWDWISPWIANEDGTRIGWCQHEESEIRSPVVVGHPLEYGKGFER